jgi:hypothetical protein
MWREFTVRAGLCSENGNRLRAFEDGVVESSKILASCAAAGVQRAMTGGAGVSPYAPAWRGQVVSASRKACANAWHRGFDWAKREMQAKNGGAS